MDDSRNLFENMPVGTAVKKMAVPTVIGQLIVLIYSMADTFFVGRTNNPYMVAAASLILPVFNMAIPIASIAGVGGEALFLGVMRWAVFNIPMLFILNHFFGMYGLVWSQLSADILTVILSFAVHRNYVRKNIGDKLKNA